MIEYCIVNLCISRRSNKVPNIKSAMKRVKVNKKKNLKSVQNDENGSNFVAD